MRAHRFLESRIKQGRIVVAKTSEDVIGMLIIAPDGFFLQGGPQVWLLSDLWVDRGWRRQGIATALIHAAEERARQLGVDELRLSVYQKNGPARVLYSGQGYEPLAEELRKRLN
jgi:ribosomal protein S18 acetylase RimI-like enzyme